MNDLISIIIPAYNVENYIEKCIQSASNQTYPNIEIICINDGSSDNTKTVIERCARTDPRIVLIDQCNSGVSAARNAGVKSSKGKYVIFLDGDDWIDPRMCEELHAVAVRENADCVMCTHQKEYSHSSVTEHTMPYTYKVFPKEEIDLELRRRLIGPIDEELSHPEKTDKLICCWQQLYRADLIKDILFKDINEIGSFEDGLYQIEVYSRCNKFVYTDVPWYHYRRNNQSSLTSVYRPDLISQWDRLFDYLSMIVAQSGARKALFEKAYYNRVAISAMGLGLNAIKGKSFSDRLNSMKTILSDDRRIESYKKLDFSFLQPHWKVFFFLCKKRMPILLMILLKMMEIIRKTR